MERIVGGRELAALLPGVDRIHQRLPALGNDEIDEHRRAARQRRARPAVVIVGGTGAHERHVEVGVRIDAAGHDETALGVDHLVAVEAGADRFDRLALNQHIGDIGTVSGDDGSAFDQSGHLGLSSCSIAFDVSSGYDFGLLQSRVHETLAPAVDHSCLMSSLSLWLTPSTHGVKTIEVGVTRER